MVVPVVASEDCSGAFISVLLVWVAVLTTYPPRVTSASTWLLATSSGADVVVVVVDEEGVGGMGDVAVVATVGGSTVTDDVEVVATEVVVRTVAAAGLGRAVADSAGVVVASVPENDDEGVAGKLVELPRSGSSRTGVTWKREKRPAPVVVAGGAAAAEVGGAMDTACGRAGAGSCIVHGADVMVDTGTTGVAAVAATPPAAGKWAAGGPGMLLLPSVDIWPAECTIRGTDATGTPPPGTGATSGCVTTAPSEWETVAGCSANTTTGGTTTWGCECAGVSTGVGVTTVFCEKMACSPCSMLLFMVLPCSFCSSSFRSSRLVATAGLRGSGGTDEGREVDGAVTTVDIGGSGAAATAAAATDVGAAMVTVVATDVAVLLSAGCLGEAGVAAGTGSHSVVAAVAPPWSVAGCCKRTPAATAVGGARVGWSDARVAAGAGAAGCCCCCCCCGGGWAGPPAPLGVVSSTSLCCRWLRSVTTANACVGRWALLPGSDSEKLFSLLRAWGVAP